MKFSSYLFACPSTKFLSGFLLGAAVMTAYGIATTRTWFAPPVSAYEEYHDSQKKLTVSEWRRAELTWQLENTQLLLDAERRSQGNPVNPKGVVVPAGDLIPAPAVPFPIQPFPVQPVNPDK